MVEILVSKLKAVNRHKPSCFIIKLHVLCLSPNNTRESSLGIVVDVCLSKSIQLALKSLPSSRDN